MLTNLAFFISEAFIGIRRSALMITLSVATITLSLLVFGLFLFITTNMNNVLEGFSSNLEIRVFLKPDLTKAEIAEFKNTLQELPDVDSVEFIERNAAWKKFQENFDAVNLSDLVESNPLPHAFKLKLLTHNGVKERVAYLKGFTDIVEDISYLGVVAQRLEIIAHFVKLLGLILVVSLTLATLLIVINTIRLTIIARKDEIEIMKLVGATVPFIRGPFLIEGLFIGVCGSVCAATILHFAYSLFSANIQSKMPYIPIISSSLVINGILGVIIIMGMFLGVFGAYISISNTIKSS